MEDRRKLVDCIKVGYQGKPPHTRVMGYKGTSSYLDKWYVSETLWPLISISKAFVADFFEANGTHFSDHQRVGLGLGKATLCEVDKPKGYHGWSTKQIDELQKIMKRWSSNRRENGEIPVEYSDLCN